MIWLFNKECKYAFKDLPDKMFDFILTDPPYGVSGKSNDISRTNKDISLNYGMFDVFKNRREYENFTREWLVEAIRCLKPYGWLLIFFDSTKLDIITKIALEHNVIQRSLFAWCKSNPAPSYRKYNMVSGVEYAWIGSKGKCRIPNFLGQKLMVNWEKTKNKRTWGETGHPNEKPVDLARRFVRIFTNEHGKILDPFMGSGSFGVASVLENRKYVGIERRLDYYLEAQERILNTQQENKEQGDFLLI